MFTQIVPTFRYWLRAAIYTAVPQRLLRHLQRVPEHATGAYWDVEAPRLMSPDDVDCMVGNAIRDRATAALLRHCGPTPRRVLDVGCALGRLADALVPDGVQTYVGVDLSEQAITLAKTEHAHLLTTARVDLRFVAGPLQDFVPEPGERFDAIVFNEVLYYLHVDEAVAECRRAAAWLNDGGVLCVSMKHDPKSAAIFGRLRRQFGWIHGAVFQLRGAGPRYAVVKNRQTPASLIGVFAAAPRQAA